LLSDRLPSSRRINKRSPKDKRKWYGDSNKLEAVKLYLLTGNLKLVSASLDIPYITLRSWKGTDWWNGLVKDLKTEDTIKLTQKLRAIASKAMDVTMDRLEHGDFYFNQKTGALERKPVAMRDAHLVAIGHTDRAMVLDKKPQEEEDNQKTQDRLIQLAEAFAKFAGKAHRIEVIDAIPKEREEGLQAGSSVGEDQEALTFDGSCEEGSGPEDGGEECGEPTHLDSRGSQEATDGGGLQQEGQPSYNVSLK
jgi:hypothetical protein